MLWKTLLMRHSESDLKAALLALTLIVRGPKPSAALREIGLVPNVQVPEPNTWRNFSTLMRDRPENRLALQEYGKSNTELIEGLHALGKRVTPVRIYGWDLPDDTGPLREAAAKLIARRFRRRAFHHRHAVVNLMKIAAREGIEQQVLEALAQPSSAPSAPPPPRLSKTTVSRPISSPAIRRWAFWSTKPPPGHPPHRTAGSDG